MLTAYDAEFIRLLNELREGKPSSEAISTFTKLSRPVQYADNIEPTRLYPLRIDVKNANKRKLAALSTEPKLFASRDVSGCPADNPGMLLYPDANKLEKYLDKHLIVEANLTLKIGAQVMLVKVRRLDNPQGGITEYRPQNLRASSKLVNGSIGKIVGFLAATQAAGSPEDLAEHGAFTSEEIGIAYDRRKLAGPNVEDDYVPPGIWPVVEFKNGRKMLLPEMEFTVDNAKGETEATRIQVPLILAWA